MKDPHDAEFFAFPGSNNVKLRWAIVNHQTGHGDPVFWGFRPIDQVAVGVARYWVELPGVSFGLLGLRGFPAVLCFGDGSYALFGVRRSVRVARGGLRGFQRQALMLDGRGLRFPCSARRANSHDRRDAGNEHPGQADPICSVHKAAL